MSFAAGFTLSEKKYTNYKVATTELNTREAEAMRPSGGQI